LPVRSWFLYRRRVSQLNAFLVGLMRQRWAARQAGKAPARGDILDRILAALEVCDVECCAVLCCAVRVSFCWPCTTLAQPDLCALALHCRLQHSSCAQASGTKWSAAIETQLCYEMKTFLLAGHETSAAMLMWSVYELTKNQQARDKVSCGGAV
jgi:hypothetical protein